MTNTNEARIETSTLCNFSCKFCPHAFGLKRKKEVMSLSLLKTIITKLKNEAPYITDITLSGLGECFTDNSVIDKIKFIDSLGYNIHLLTNGSLLDKSMIQTILNYNIMNFRFSVHSLDLNNFYKITKSNKLNKVVENINEVRRIINEKKLKTKLIITTDVIEENKNDVDRVVEYFTPIADLIEVWKPHNWTDWTTYRNGDTIKQTCGRPINGPLQIQVDGTINMCCFDYNGVLLLGDFKTQTLQQIFNSDNYKKILKWHNGDKSFDILCNICDQLKDNGDIIIYNSKNDKDRVNKTSTNYKHIL